MSPQQTDTDHADELLTEINGDTFADWYSERQFAKNIREGRPYFNGSSPVPPPSKHSPSQLLQCHRKSYYRAHNAPKESADPHGIFWIGEQFETEIALPFLRSLVDDDQYVRNSMWIDTTVETEQEILRLRGETDPVVVDSNSDPHLVTEIKTTSSVENMDHAKRHHKAQVHAYMRGLTEKHDRAVDDAVILYADRNSLTVQTFHTPFDQSFWENEALDWAVRNTEYRDSGTLPPAQPESEWECSFCAYRHRCGKTDHHSEDDGPIGFLPLYKYPRAQVETYLDAHPDAGLTPTVAEQYPNLAESYEVFDWRCPVCGSTFDNDEIDWSGDTDYPPQCPTCTDDGVNVLLGVSGTEEKTGCDSGGDGDAF